MEIGAVTLTLDRLLHTGTFNSIFLARRNTDDRFLAAKLYDRTHMQNQPDLAHLALNEKRMLEVASTVPHVNLLGFEGLLLTAAAACLCLEAVSGGDLFTLLQTHGPFAPEQARIYVGEVCLALGHLHSLDIIHRNVTVRIHAGTHTHTHTLLCYCSERR
jgi:serine/threonine protein kinase